MDHNKFTHQMTGQWITQSTNYPLSSYSINSSKLMNRMTWINISDQTHHISSIKQSINRINMKDSIYLYKVQFTDAFNVMNNYYVALLYETTGQVCLWKLNNKLEPINQFIIQNYSTYHLSLMSSIGNITILEKIYFLNTNVKIIKSIIKRANKYVATSFSSEIRIS